MPTSLSLAMQTTFNEVISSNAPAISASGNQLIHNGMNLTGTLTSTGTTVVTTGTIFNATLSGGSATVDLTSLTGTNGSAVDLSGLKVHCIHLKNPSAAQIVLTKGGSNGYGFGSGGTSGTIVVPPNGQCIWYTPEGGTPDVAGGAKTWDLTGTGSQVLQIGVWAG